MFKKLFPYISATKICEKSIFNEMLKFFIKNELISSNYLRFIPGDSGINKLLAITHEIF